MNRNRNIAFVIFAMVFLAACGRGFVNPADPVYREFRELCETKAGTHIYETVKDVDGVLGIRPLPGLLRYGYSFVEYEIPETIVGDDLRLVFATGPGLHRYSLEAPKHSNCKIFYEIYSTGPRAGRSIPEKFGGKCLATERIDHPTAKYAFSDIWKETARGGTPGELSAFSQKFTSVGGDKVYAEHNSYRYTPRGAGRNWMGAYHGINCPARGSQDFTPPNIDSIFIPRYKN